jgi:hypothetical protein
MFDDLGSMSDGLSRKKFMKVIWVKFAKFKLVGCIVV